MTDTSNHNTKSSSNDTINHNIREYSHTTMMAWQNALEATADSVEKPINTKDKAGLNGLPIFAMIVVINNPIFHQKMEDTDKANTNINESGEPIITVQRLMNNWSEAQKQTPANWQIANVDDYDQSNVSLLKTVLATIDKEEDRVSDVSIFRYVLTPNSAEMLQGNMSEEKRNAIAHVLDDQLSHHFAKAFSHLVDGIDESVFDCHILPVANLLQVHKVACFDMDSTLIEQEVIVELAKATGIGKKVNEITESAMRGEIDFSESFAQRVRLLHGTSADLLEDISDGLTLSAGAQTTLKTLNAMGYHTVLVSGGFTYFAKVIAGKLQMAEYHANELMIEESKVIGEAKLPILDGQRKADITQQIAKHLGVDMSEVICIGDGANDLLMMAAANLGFAYHAKPIVQAKANLAINCTGLEGVLYGLGYGRLF